MRRIDFRSSAVLTIFALLAVAAACAPQESPSQESPSPESISQEVSYVAQIPDAQNAQLTWIADGFDRPLFVTHAGDGSGRLFVVEQTGRIRILQDGKILEEPFLDASDVADWLFAFDEENNYSENGLLGLAFHPDYEENGYVFIYYTDREGDSALARYRVDAADPNRADAASGQVILSVDQPHHWHNGGMLAFGPDGYLYLALGDGGGKHGNPCNNGQRRDTLLGKILRLDVGVSEVADYSVPPDNPYVGNELAKPEIWAYGLRNPWRFSFDHVTGDLWIGDVGESRWEEINYQLANSPGGENYGWGIYEGYVVYTDYDDNVRYADNKDLPLEETALPAFTYSHNEGISITAGYVYRGDAIADLYGVFLFGDFGSGRIWTIYRREDGGWQVNEYMDTEHFISSFGEDEAGELYVVDYFDGSIWQFLPRE